MYRKFKELDKEELILAIEEAEYLGSVLINLGCIDNTYNRNKLKEFIELNNISTSHIKSKLTKSSYEENPKRCKYCNKIIPYELRRNDFCNHSCAASYNNQGVCRNGNPLPEHSYCLNCNKEITRGNKFCDNTCAAKYREKQYIIRWKRGEEDGLSGKYGIITAVRNYIFEKNNNECECCHKNYINPYTNLSILQIHHIDGDCTNNKEENLQLLCPNCHSLTENFGSLNKNSNRFHRPKITKKELED